MRQTRNHFSDGRYLVIEIFTGLILGLLSATLSESFGHRIFGHPNAHQLKLYFKYPRFFAPFLRAYYHHFVIHHENTFQQDVLTQFRNENEKHALDRWIAKEFPTDFANLIWREKYNLTLKGLQGILPFAIPFLTGPLFIALIFGRVSFAASLTVAFLPVLMSKYIHPFIHQPELLSLAPRPVQLIAKTRYMKWIFRNHYLHHLHVESNYNLLLGGDRILRVHREPTHREAEELARLWRKFEGAWQNT